MFFDIGPFEMVALVVLAVVIFGPDKLPKVISEVMGFIRKVREFSDSAKADIRQELGPEFQDLDFSDLTPRGFVKKNLLDNPRIKTSGELQELRELRNGFDLDGIRDDVRTLTSAPSDGDAAPSSGGVDTATRDDSGSGPARRQDADERPPFDPDAT
ncbi:sec-independent translocase [Phaeacidiphilus oryzae]|uniref:sec-independent translocase n=1 Tax=Phaeacidiphilus oryzae TaxID=348818 RepID=UPI0005606EDB|nr:sec-independent translocase [Phaeacidiphilus oryzae]